MIRSGDTSHPSAVASQRRETSPYIRRYCILYRIFHSTSTFVPHLTPMIRGIHATLYAELMQADIDLQALFTGRYAQEPFVTCCRRAVIQIRARCAAPICAGSPCGCSGFQYGFTFDEQVGDGDTIVEKRGVKLLVDPMSDQYLVGAEIDYTEGLDGAQFVIRNPNATTTCGCGSSFSV